MPSTSSKTGSNLRGTLHGVVTRNGKLSLRRNGKAVTSLKAGRYTVSVDDQSTRRDFRIRTPQGKVQTITSAGYVGWQEVTVTLGVGRWSFFALGGRRRYSSSSPDDP